MGINSKIEIELSSTIKPVDLLTILLKAGWRYGAYDEIMYLPVGDDGLFNWQSLPSDQWDDVEKICRLKEEQAEIVGVDLTWENSRIGGLFLFYPGGKIEVLAAINRISLSSNITYTDFSWYTSRILGPLVRERANITSITCLDAY